MPHSLGFDARKNLKVPYLVNPYGVNANLVNFATLAVITLNIANILANITGSAFVPWPNLTTWSVCSG